MYPVLYSVLMSSCTISFEYTWPTFVRICARMRSLLIVAGPVYCTSMARMTGGPGGTCGACPRTITAVKSVQKQATQIAIGGGRVHPQKRCICQKRSPAQSNRRRTGGYIGNKTAIVKTRFFTESRGSPLVRRGLSCPQDGTMQIYRRAKVFSMSF